MRISIDKLEMELARQCKTISALRDGASPKTVMRIRKGLDVTPKTAGRIAKALGVDVAEIVETSVNT